MAQEKDKQAYQRKDAHLNLAKQELAKAQIAHPLDTVHLRHYALPDCKLDDISLATSFCGHRLASPLFIGAMTGGTDRADGINAALAEVAAEKNIALALGSQRTSYPKSHPKSLAETASQMALVGNLGITQLAASGFDLVRAIDVSSNHYGNPLKPVAKQPKSKVTMIGVAPPMRLPILLPKALYL